MLNRLIKIALLIGLALVLGYGAINLYSCATANRNPDDIRMPNESRAAYTVYIENTGNLILTSDYDVQGYAPGLRIYTIRGYYEVSGERYRFRDNTVVLDESIFGLVTVKPRPQG